MTWRESSIDGMTFQWRRENETTHIVLSSKDKGWVAVGFNDRPVLNGSRLFMGRVTPDEVTVEEHWTRPPNHGALSDQSAISGISGTEHNGTEIRFSIRDIDASAIHVTLAWSTHDDFSHHSRVRSMVRIDD